MRRFTLVLLLCTAMVVFGFQIVYADPDEIHVPYDYFTIQEAINTAGLGDTVIVHAGTYPEHITLNQSISLIGEGEAVIDGSGTGTVVNVSVTEVYIRGLTIRNGGSNWTARDSGIKIVDGHNVVVEENRIENSRIGIFLWDSMHIQIVANTIVHHIEGILATYSPENTIEANNLENNDINIFLDGIDSHHNRITHNTAFNGSQGIHLQYWSSNNTIYGNTLIENEYGVMLSQSQNNTFYHNNFIDNVNQAWLGSNSINNEWDADWPDGGNYWSDHNNVDAKSGPNQLGPGSDGIADTAYTVYTGNLDRYPCGGLITYFSVHYMDSEEIPLISNSSISDFQMNTTEQTIVFKVTGVLGVGFCRVDIPNTLVSGMWQNNYSVLVNDTPIEFGNWTAGSLTYIYFRYPHSTQDVTLIPEYSSLALITLLTASLIFVLVLKKRNSLS